MLRQHGNGVVFFLRADVAAFLTILIGPLLLVSCKGDPPIHAVTPQQVLTIAHENPYLSLDPQEKNDSVTWSVIGNVYEPLVEFDRNMKIAGRLAERWENPNDLTWRFYLRKGVRFHDGKEFTAEDVAFTIRRALDGNRAGTKPYLISVKEVQVIDPLTLDIITDRPNPVLLNRLTFVFMLPSSAGVEPVRKPIGTGPYVFDREEIAGRKLLLHSNLNYWKRGPTIPRVQFISFNTENEMVEALLKGSVQLIRDYPEKLIPRVEASGTCEVVTHDGLGVAMLGFNLTEAGEQPNPLLRLQVREAVSLAIDGGRLVKEALEGRATVVRQLVSPVIFGFDPKLTPEPPNRERARELLSEGGYPNGFATELYGNDDQRLYKLASLIREIDLDVEARLVPWDELYDKMIGHEIPMYTLSWSCSTGDASDFLDSCVHSPDPDSGYGNFNMANYRNPEVDRLIELSGRTLKTNERKDYLQKALALAARDLPYVPLYSRYRHYGVSKRIAWQPRRDGRLYAEDMSWKQSQ